VEGALPSRLAKVEAQVPALHGMVQALEDQVRDLMAHVKSHEAAVRTVQELLALLKANDDAFDTLERLIRPASVHSQRTLQRFLWGKIGRALHQNDIIPAQ
jgi:phage shock protein A